MTSEKNTGRVVGLVLLTQALIAPLIYIRLLPPLSSADYLATAAPNALQVSVALLLTLLMGALTIAVAITTWPVVRRRSERMALLYVALSAVGLATFASESVALRNMLALSLEVARSGATSDVLQTLGRVARSTWLGAHFTNLTVTHTTALFFFAILFRFRLVPRPLAGFGVATTLVSTPAVIMPLLGVPFRFALIAPLGVSTLGLVLWLLARGFDGSPRPSAPALEMSIA
jgi:hypothetical protein